MLLRISSKIILVIVLNLMFSCSTGEYDMDPRLIEFEEPGFSIKFNDASNCTDGGFLVVGRFEMGEHETYKSIYNYDISKHPDYVSGSSSMDFPVAIVRKMDASGNPQWTHTFSNMKEGLAVATDGNGHHYVAGFTVIDPGDELLQTVVVTCITERGLRKWSKQIGWKKDSYPVGVRVMGDGKIALLATVESSSRESQMRWIIMSPDATVTMDKIIPGTPYLYDSRLPAEFIEEDGVTWVLGSNRTKASTELFGLDNGGEILHRKEYSWGGWNYAYSMDLASEGIVYTSDGYQDDDRSGDGSHLVALDKQLNIRWEDKLGTDAFDPSQVVVDDEDRIIFAGANSDTEEPF